MVVMVAYFIIHIFERACSLASTCYLLLIWSLIVLVARCSSVVREFAHGAMGRRIDLSWDGPIELILVQASVP